jgi:hypothetical protein
MSINCYPPHKTLLEGIYYQHIILLSQILYLAQCSCNRKDRPNEHWNIGQPNRIFLMRSKVLAKNIVFHHYVGLNILSNRFYSLNDKITLESLNKSFTAYKMEMKKKSQCTQPNKLTLSLQVGYHHKIS